MHMLISISYHQTPIDIVFTSIHFLTQLFAYMLFFIHNRVLSVLSTAHGFLVSYRSESSFVHL